jgi:hypothetical protein
MCVDGFTLCVCDAWLATSSVMWADTIWQLVEVRPRDKDMKEIKKKK